MSILPTDVGKSLEKRGAQLRPEREQQAIELAKQSLAIEQQKKSELEQTIGMQKQLYSSVVSLLADAEPKTVLKLNHVVERANKGQEISLEEARLATSFRQDEANERVAAAIKNAEMKSALSKPGADELLIPLGADLTANEQNEKLLAERIANRKFRIENAEKAADIIADSINETLRTILEQMAGVVARKVEVQLGDLNMQRTVGGILKTANEAHAGGA